MENVSSQHAEHARAASYGFSEDRHLGVYVCAHVAARAPILYVSHDADGDWQFLCGQRHEDAEGARLICLEQVVAADPTLNAIAALPSGQQSVRDGIGAEWSISDPSEQFIQRCVAEFGWCVQGVEAEADKPAFAYSIGLQQSFGQPELIVFGLPHEAAQRLLNLIGERVRDGMRFEPGIAYGDLVAAHDVKFREVVDPASLRDHVGYALWYYQGQPLSLAQIIWPDAKGVFPDAQGAPDWLQKAQPLLK